MKRVVSILLAAVMLASLLAVVPSARGYTLSIPETVSAHNLEAYGLHTMNVYSTDVPPTIDGVIGVADENVAGSKNEYPGPNNGRSLSSVPGDNLWMSSFDHATSGSQNDYNPKFNWTDYVAKEDMPDYINTYLTYDDEYLYFAVSAKIPAIRKTTDTTEGQTRSGLWFVDTRLNFMQSDNIALAHGGDSSSYAQNRYNLYKFLERDAEGNILPQTAQSVNISKRVYTLYEDSKFKTVTLDAYVDEIGQTWGSGVYKRSENFTYKVTVLSDGKWGVIFEGRQPLADILRITDVEYEDGTPIDYVPEWGAWGFDVRLQAYHAKMSTLPNGAEVAIRPEDVIYAQTFLPAGPVGYNATDELGSVAGYQLQNTVGLAVKSVHGKSTVTPTFLMNPVHFLGAYDETFNYDGFYATPTESVLKETSRVTRTRGILTSGVRGVNHRVVGVATKAAVATGDNLTLTMLLSAVMILSAAGAVTAVFMKKRSSRSH